MLLDLFSPVTSSVSWAPPVSRITRTMLGITRFVRGNTLHRERQFHWGMGNV